MGIVSMNPGTPTPPPTLAPVKPPMADDTGALAPENDPVGPNQDYTVNPDGTIDVYDVKVQAEVDITLY